MFISKEAHQLLHDTINELKTKNQWLHSKWREAAEEATQHYNELEKYKDAERGLQRIEAYQKVIEKAIDKRPSTKFIKEILLDAKTYNLFKEFISNSVGEDKADIDREMADAFNTIAGTPLTQIKMIVSNDEEIEFIYGTEKQKQKLLKEIEKEQEVFDELEVEVKKIYDK